MILRAASPPARRACGPRAPYSHTHAPHHPRTSTTSRTIETNRTPPPGEEGTDQHHRGVIRTALQKALGLDEGRPTISPGHHERPHLCPIKYRIVRSVPPATLGDALADGQRSGGEATSGSSSARRRPTPAAPTPWPAASSTPGSMNDRSTTRASPPTLGTFTRPAARPRPEPPAARSRIDDHLGQRDDRAGGARSPTGRPPAPGPHSSGASSWASSPLAGEHLEALIVHSSAPAPARPTSPRPPSPPRIAPPSGLDRDAPPGGAPAALAISRRRPSRTDIVGFRPPGSSCFDGW